MKLLITTPEFFATPFKKLEVEDAVRTDPEAPLGEKIGTGLTYFLKAGRIVAVGQPSATAQ